MRYEDWEAAVPDSITSDTLWHVRAYRLALFLSDLAWADVTKVAKDRRTSSTADQLFRATGNISSNISEGYSRDSAKSRAIFYDYALGSTRESRDWYYKARHVLGAKVATHRMNLCAEIIRLVITMAANERRTNRRISTTSPKARAIPL